MVGRTSDVFIESHYKDGASVAAGQSFGKLRGEIKKTEDQAVKASKEFATFGKVVGGLVTIEMLRKIGQLGFAIVNASKEGQTAIKGLSAEWGAWKASISQTTFMPVINEMDRLLRTMKLIRTDAGQLLAESNLRPQAALDVNEMVPYIEYLKGNKTPEAVAAAKIVREKEVREQEKQHQADLQRAEKQQRDFEDLAKRLGPGTVGRNMGMTGGRPSLLAGIMDPSSGAAKKATDLSGQSAYISGGKTGEQLALGFKHGLQTNKQDFSNPAENMSFDIATDFRANFIGVLSQGYQDLLGGNFEDAIKGVGGGVFTSVVGGFTGELAKQTVDSEFGKKLTGFVGEGTTKAVEGIGGIVSKGLDEGLDMNRLRAIGSRAGGWLKGGVDAGFDWLMPDVSASWGPQGATFTAIKGGMTDALKGGIMGAGIGTMIAGFLGSSEITAKYTQIGASIGGAIGGAIAGPAGSLVGSLIGTIGGQVWQTGASKQQEGAYKELLTDVSSFGGAKGFFNRIGGLSGFNGDRKRALAGHGRKDFATLLRLTEGATAEQANWFTQFLRGDDVYLSQHDEDQVLNLMRKLGFSEEDVATARGKITTGPAQDSIPVPGGTYVGTAAGDTGGTTTPPAGTTTPPAGATTPPAGATTPPAGATTPPAGATHGRAPTSNIERAQNLLRTSQITGQLSASELKYLGWSGVVSQAINDMGGAWPSVGSSIKTVLNGGKGYSPQDEGAIKRALGVDIVAAKGFMGTVNRPTRFLAGEAGPEDVMVIPQAMRRGITGGGSGRGGSVLNVTMQINTPNVETTREWARREFYPMIRSMLMEDSNNGVPILRSRGVVQG